MDRFRSLTLVIAVLMGGLYLRQMATSEPSHWSGSLYMAAVLGFSITALIAYGSIVKRNSGAARNPILLVLESRQVVWLGAISYSLYLIHAPVLALTHAALNAAGITARHALALEIAVGVPVSVAAGWIVNRFLEQPSHKRARRTLVSRNG